ncbi:MAG: DUF368 domain-containing protein [Saprospiraceae bacterium]|nr:DUF368 domain-containing protein [Saprospiraceae bacterium]
MNYNFSTALKGTAMGIAEVIPGVSGGTIAFISGIYEDLLNSIKSFDIELIRMLMKGRFKDIWDKINGWFLLSLLSGMIVGIVFGIFVITWMMEHYPEPLWGFFFGLVMASAILIGKHTSKWDVFKVIALISGAALAIIVSVITPAEGSTHPLYIFLAGMIAISAFILPGVSGSFMLLLMGMYTLIIPSLKKIMTEFDTHSMYIIAIFATGCIIGIMWFSRLLSWLFTHYRENTFVLLTGFLIGSLYKIWPWRNVSVVVDKNTGLASDVNSLTGLQSFDPEIIKILKETNVLPSDYWMSSPKLAMTLAAMVIGFAIVLYMAYKTKDASMS